VAWRRGPGFLGRADSKLATATPSFQSDVPGQCGGRSTHRDVGPGSKSNGAPATCRSAEVVPAVRRAACESTPPPATCLPLKQLKPMPLSGLVLRPVRLACQLRPAVNVAARPLLHPSLVTSRPLRSAQEFGEEREVTILFVDIRGSTSLAERRLPYDVVFLLNYLFAGLTEAVEKAGGYYSNFTGDGLMALFGLETVRDKGARTALTCALSMFETVDGLNERLAGELKTPLAIGVGIHTGEAIVGRMGPPKTPIVSAIGDSVNTTARLEDTTKELGSSLVVSVDTLRAAGLTAPMPLQQISLRGRSTNMSVAALDATSLRQLLSSRRG